MLTFQRFQAVEKLMNNDLIREDPGFSSGTQVPIRALSKAFCCNTDKLKWNMINFS
jgi:hypothetical protein